MVWKKWKHCSVVKEYHYSSVEEYQFHLLWKDKNEWINKHFNDVNFIFKNPDSGYSVDCNMKAAWAVFHWLGWNTDWCIPKSTVLHRLYYSYSIYSQRAKSKLCWENTKYKGIYITFRFFIRHKDVNPIEQMTNLWKKELYS